MTREEAIKMLKSKMDGTVDTSYEWAETVRMAIEALHKTEAQVEVDEWCADCKEYDHERHCCPRWNKVIRETLKDMQMEKRTKERTGTHACDCVSRQAAIEALSTPHGILYPIRTVEELPSVQPELIRCKDCKHWGKRGLCDKWDYYISNGDFYCGCAERIEG